MKKVWKYLALTIPAFAAFGVGVMVSIIGMIFYFIISIYQVLLDYNNGDVSMALTDNMDIFVEVLTYIIPIFWAITFFFWYRNLTKREEVTRIKLFTFHNISMLALMGFGISLLTTGLMCLILPHFEKLMREYTELMEEAFNGNQIGLFIGIIILAPISEELIFRGVILKKACRVTPFIVANIIQAALFGIFHMNIVQGIYTFGGGLVLGYVAYKFKSIKASILLHLFFNASNYIPINPDTVIFQIICAVTGVVLLIFTINKMKNVGDLNQVSAIPVDTFE